MRVLIVDDSPIIADRLVTLLSEVSAEIRVVGQACDVGEALIAARELKPDVLILDLGLPSGSGIDVLGDVKRRDPVPVVMILTNYPYPQYRKRCLELGADFFFDKSTELDSLREAFVGLLHVPPSGPPGIERHAAPNPCREGLRPSPSPRHEAAE